VPEDRVGPNNPNHPDNPGQSGARALMRTAADRLARSQSLESERCTCAPSPEAMQAALQELQVHQIELEMQNDELQQAQLALEASRTRYFELYDLAPVGYVTIGEDGIIKEANLTSATLLGVLRSDLVQTRFSRFVFHEHQDIFYRLSRQLLESGTSQVCELQLTRPNNTVFWVRMEATLVRDAEGTSTFRAVLSDISERKRTQQEQERLQTQLAQAQKLEAIGSLAGGIAHDFNNILTGLLGGLSMLEAELSSKHQSDIDEMKGLVERAANLTQSLLGFARRGKFDVHPLNLALAVDNAVTMFGRTRKDITIQYKTTTGLFTVMMDGTQLEQVLLNLLINAGQAMPEGGRITVDMANIDGTHRPGEPPGSAEAHFVRLVIADTGSGMDAATQLRIFEPFFTTKDIGKGTGLGLASAYGIIQSHGGTIRVESELGKGTVFTMLLPAATDRARKLETIPAQPLLRGTETILVVDDEEPVRRVAIRVLTRLGYTVLSASSGRQALKIVEQHSNEISVVLLDMTMPEMSGAETYRRLQVSAPNTKVLLCSGYSVEGEAQTIVDNGCNGFLQKPYDSTTLAAKMREVLSMSVGKANEPMQVQH
jgi:two-component system, cell cycle sensor histidine kinase and response regulator CckA